jgi:UDP-glucuronate 4-epimerase
MGTNGLDGVASATHRTVLVTGGLGCVGAWTIRLLLDRGDRPIVFDLGEDRHRLELVLTPDELANLIFIQGDIGELTAVETAIDSSDATDVIHLAALQIPFCAADPSMGARVNVVGTVNVFEAVKRRRDRLNRVTYASSDGVYGPTDGGTDGAVPEDAEPHPLTHYGVYKVANEGTARVYWHQDGLPSTAIRPYVIFGPGRDQGLTSSPTTAMLAAALGRSYEISYSGRSQLQYVRDVALAFVSAMDARDPGARVFNMGGDAVAMTDVVEAIEAAAPNIKGRISVAERTLPYPEAFTGSAHEALDLPAATPLRDAVRETVDTFRRSFAEGKIRDEALG